MAEVRRSDGRIATGECAVDRAPRGWYCLRAAGHEGPCAPTRYSRLRRWFGLPPASSFSEPQIVAVAEDDGRCPVISRNFGRCAATAGHAGSHVPASAFKLEDIRPEAIEGDVAVIERAMRRVLSETYVPEGVDRWIEARGVSLRSLERALDIEGGAE